jgi:hypothetical protein
VHGTVEHLSRYSARPGGRFSAGRSPLVSKCLGDLPQRLKWVQRFAAPEGLRLTAVLQ